MKSFKYLGKTVKAIRTANKLTQAQLAQKLGVHSQFVSNVERGLCGFPEKPMQKLAKKFEVTAKLKKAIKKDAALDAQIYCNQVFAK